MKLATILGVLVLLTLGACEFPRSGDTGTDSAFPYTDVATESARCAKRGGLWSKSGSELFVCVMPTGEGQKSCKSGSDCKGECLAASGSCAPYKPLLGCNEVISATGLPTTLCID